MKTLYFVLTALLLFTINIFSAPWDTGYIVISNSTQIVLNNK